MLEVKAVGSTAAAASSGTGECCTQEPGAASTLIANVLPLWCMDVCSTEVQSAGTGVFGFDLLVDCGVPKPSRPSSTMQ